MTNKTAQTISFMAFWKGINEALKDRGQPEMKFGDVRHLWEIAADYDRQDREQAFARKLKKLAA